MPQILVNIGICESGGRQFNGDDVLRGLVNPLDTGEFQINKYYWGDEADRLGFDIETRRGNRAMALWIYKTHGTWPWNASRSCWEAMPAGS